MTEPRVNHSSAPDLTPNSSARQSGNPAGSEDHDRIEAESAADADPSVLPEQSIQEVIPQSETTGGDLYSNQEQAEVVGEEAIGGTTPTPDQNRVDDVAAAVGINLDDRTPVRVNTMMEERDDQRWELDPQSSEDYDNRGA